MESFRCRVKRQFSSWGGVVRMRGIVCRDGSMFVMCCEREILEGLRECGLLSWGGECMMNVNTIS